ncbi:twitch domain-containing radical SAM protein [bacterium]|nr:twitch domain-containing radical SAM protein [bacterium]
MSKNYECPYLENSLMLSPTSEVRPCCRFDVSKYEIKDFTWDNQTPLAQFYKRPQFERLREKSRAGERVEGCHRCYREEELGIKSMRLKSFPGLTSKNSSNHIDLSVIELGVGRVCNLKCRTCDPYFSTKWEADAKAALKPLPDASLDVNLDAIDVASFQKTTSLKITGGEPFYNPAFERLIERLVNARMAQQIDIEIFTNATRAPSLKFLEKLNEFKSLTVSLSIDGYKEKNTYIRNPSRWQDVERTTQFWLDKNKIQVNFAVTVSILNVLSLFELFHWLIQMSNEKEPNILIQNVSDPKHLNISCWPHNIREKLHKEFCKQKSDFLTNKELSSKLHKRLENIEKKLLTNQEESGIVERFWQETIVLDKKRDESFFATFDLLFSILKADTFCSRPFTSRVVTPSGMIRPCCESRSQFSYVEKDFIQLQTDLLSGVKNKDCKECWEKERLGLDSSLRNKNSLQDLSSVRFLDLNLSNKCNLTCRMCGSDSSDAWSHLEKRLLQNPEIRNFRTPQIAQFVKAFNSDDEFIVFLNSLNLRRIEGIKIAGGEPFMQKNLTLLLQKLLDEKCENVSILIHTNGTVWNENIMNLLTKFSNVYIRLSVEANGDLYKYIRGGSKYSFTDLNEFLLRLKNETRFQIGINAAISAFSVFGLADFFIWVQKNIGTLEDSFHAYPVFVPEYLSPFVLPKLIRQEVYEYNKKILLNSEFGEERMIIKLQRFFFQDESDQGSKFSQFLKFTEELDKIQGTSFMEVLPNEKIRGLFKVTQKADEVRV